MIESVENILVDDLPFLREIRSALMMLRLLQLHSPAEAVIFALQFRGSSRIIRVEDAEFFVHTCLAVGWKRAWTVALRARMFEHADRPILPGFSFALNDLSDTQCRERFRFDHRGIKLLVILLQMPAVIIVPSHRDRVSAVEALLLVCERMASPKRWSDLTMVYNRHVSALSRIFNYMMHVLSRGAKRFILMATQLLPERVSYYADGFTMRGVPESFPIFCVIDVKKVAICRPSTNQRAMYSGHTKFHCFKYQTLEAPDGLIIHCHAAADGRRGDGGILQDSNLIPFLRSYDAINGYYVFGDSAYPTNDVMISMYRGQNLPDWAAAFNRLMAKVRVSVEWGYNQVRTNFAYVDWRKQLKIELMSVEAIWHLGVFLSNCLTCHNGGNQISDFFYRTPPTLEEYLQPFSWIDDE